MKMEFSEVQRRIVEHEGLRLKPYKDTIGILTIGVGRNLEANGISKTEAYYLLANDIQACERDMQSFGFFNDLDAERQYVLLDMRFNLGMAGLKGFKNFLAALSIHDYAAAAKEMLDSRWVKQVPSRAKKLAEIMRTGKF